MNAVDLMGEYSIEEDYILYGTEVGNEEIEKIFLELLQEYKNNERQADIEKAKIIVSIGRGYHADRGIDDIEIIADKLNATIGGTRPLQDMNLLSADVVLGKTARKATPSVYIAFGVSGSVQHIGTIKTDTIIAINNNKNSAIFRHAKYKILGDARQIASYIRDILEKAD